jgi:hypothetical protein
MGKKYSYAEKSFEYPLTSQEKQKYYKNDDRILRSERN